MSPREQQYYYAVFKSMNIMELETTNKIKLFQFADVHCKTSNDSLNRHKQWCHEITFVYGGEGVTVHNGHEQSIKSGQVHLCFDEDIHQIIPSKSSPLRFYCIGFTLFPDNPLSKLLEEVHERITPDHSVLSGCADLQNAFQSALAALYTENQNEMTYAIAANTINYIISTVLSRFLSKEPVGHDNISIKESLLYYVISYLKNNVYQINALHSLSEDIGYSYSYLSHLFSKRMGQTLKSFFASIRMDVADKLLLEKSVTEVSDLLGYSSLHAFSRAYKSVRGYAPRTLHRGDAAMP
jgi:AraC-like DNA-binding protein/mannose-6-phosphate isomerase-like protein (cupin superfamily)